LVDPIPDVAEQLRALRNQPDPVTEARREVFPYTRRVSDALGALRALVTDDSPTAQLESDLRVVHGIVAALVGGEKATKMIESLPRIRRMVATDVAIAFEKDPSATSYGEVVAAYPSILAVTTYRIANVFFKLGERSVARIMTEDAHSRTVSRSDVGRILQQTRPGRHGKEAPPDDRKRRHDLSERDHPRRRNGDR